MQLPAIDCKQHRIIQWLLAPIVLLTIGLGWKWYWIGFLVPIVMIIGLLSPMLQRGRYVCGNACPRGAFYDRILRHVSLGKDIPSFFQNPSFRWIIFAALFGFFFWQASQPPFTTQHIGHLFWFMCTATTALGILLGVFFSHRCWCAFCPIGTWISAVGKDQHHLMIDKTRCIACKRCEKVCPFHLPITQDLDRGSLSSQECLKCLECVAVCHKKALAVKKSMKGHA